MSCSIANWPKPDGMDVVIFDLDGTLAEPQWPIRHTVGPPIPEGVELLQHYAGEGYRVMIHTARPKWDKPIITQWLRDNKLTSYVDAVICDKPAAGLYIDDRGHRPYYVDRYKEPTFDVC